MLSLLCPRGRLLLRRTSTTYRLAAWHYDTHYVAGLCDICESLIIPAMIRRC